MTKIKVNSSAVVDRVKGDEFKGHIIYSYKFADGSECSSSVLFEKGDVVDVFLVRDKFGLKLSYERQ